MDVVAGGGWGTQGGAATGDHKGTSCRAVPCLGSGCRLACHARRAVRRARGPRYVFGVCYDVRLVGSEGFGGRL